MTLPPFSFLQFLFSFKCWFFLYMPEFFFCSHTAYEIRTSLRVFCQSPCLFSELSWFTVPWNQTLPITVTKYCSHFAMSFSVIKITSRPLHGRLFPSALLKTLEYLRGRFHGDKSRSSDYSAEMLANREQHCPSPGRSRWATSHRTQLHRTTPIAKVNGGKAQSFFREKSRLCLDTRKLSSIWNSSENIYWVCCHSICIRNLAQRIATPGRSYSFPSFFGHEILTVRQHHSEATLV